jgi:hypothetical protein
VDTDEADSTSTLQEKSEDSNNMPHENGGNEENKEGLPLPVGFWEKSLNEVRKKGRYEMGLDSPCISSPLS